MAGWAKNTGRALADRKGATPLEYALIVAAIAPFVVVGFNSFAGRFKDFLSNIQF